MLVWGITVLVVAAPLQFVVENLPTMYYFLRKNIGFV
jgi:hypothetical protein